MNEKINLLLQRPDLIAKTGKFLISKEKSLLKLASCKNWFQNIGN